MRNFLLISLMLCLHLVAAAQDIEVTTVHVYKNFRKDDTNSHVPCMRSQSTTMQPIADSINNTIMDQLMIDNLESIDTETFLWDNLMFTHQIQDSILLITLSGEFVQTFPYTIYQSMFFSLHSGKRLEEQNISFHSFFSLKGYHAFLEQYWLHGCKNELKDAKECLHENAIHDTLGCNCHNIKYSTTPTNTTLEIANSYCLPPARNGCTPFHETTVPLDSIAPYLNDFGKSYLLQSQYYTMNPIDLFLYKAKIQKDIPPYVFITGSIGGKHPFSMALHLHKASPQATGYYYYNKVGKPITLNGSYTKDKIQLTELVDDNATGRFLFEISNVYKKDTYSTHNRYWTATWHSAQGKPMEVALEMVQENQPPKKVR